jgi:hypothetical protein
MTPAPPVSPEVNELFRMKWGAQYWEEYLAAMRCR